MRRNFVLGINFATFSVKEKSIWPTWSFIHSMLMKSRKLKKKRDLMGISFFWFHNTANNLLLHFIAFSLTWLHIRNDNIWKSILLLVHSQWTHRILFFLSFYSQLAALCQQPKGWYYHWLVETSLNKALERPRHVSLAIAIHLVTSLMKLQLYQMLAPTRAEDLMAVSH